MTSDFLFFWASFLPTDRERRNTNICIPYITVEGGGGGGFRATRKQYWLRHCIALQYERTNSD